METKVTISLFVWLGSRIDSEVRDRGSHELTAGYTYKLTTPLRYVLNGTRQGPSRGFPTVTQELGVQGGDTVG